MVGGLYLHVTGLIQGSTAFLQQDGSFEQEESVIKTISLTRMLSPQFVCCQSHWSQRTSAEAGTSTVLPRPRALCSRALCSGAVPLLCPGVAPAAVWAPGAAATGLCLAGLHGNWGLGWGLAHGTARGCMLGCRGVSTRGRCLLLLPRALFFRDLEQGILKIPFFPFHSSHWLNFYKFVQYSNNLCCGI